MHFTKLIQIETPFAVAGAIVNDQGVIQDAAPILRWSIGLHISRLSLWAKRKGGSVTTVPVP